jgi:hypothetical protein
MNLLPKYWRRREPDYTVVGKVDGRMYLRRWYLLPRNSIFNLYLHNITSSDDDRALHDHRGNNVSIILAGAYREHFEDGSSKVRRRGHMVYRRADMLHRLELITPTVWSLFVVGPWWRNWTFACPEGRVPNETYIANDGCISHQIARGDSPL